MTLFVILINSAIEVEQRYLEINSTHLAIPERNGESDITMNIFKITEAQKNVLCSTDFVQMT